MSETYANARARIHTALRQQHGWKSSDAGLKRLWTDSPKGYRVWFRTQAVYIGSHSTFFDIRGVNVEAFIRDIDRLAAFRAEEPVSIHPELDKECQCGGTHNP